MLFISKAALDRARRPPPAQTGTAGLGGAGRNCAPSGLGQGRGAKGGASVPEAGGSGERGRGLGLPWLSSPSSDPEDVVTWVTSVLAVSGRHQAISLPLPLLPYLPAPGGVGYTSWKSISRGARAMKRREGDCFPAARAFLYHFLPLQRAQSLQTRCREWGRGRIVSNRAKKAPEPPTQRTVHKKKKKKKIM